MIDLYANQSMALKRVTSVSDTNTPTYSSSTIKGRKETGNKLIRNAQGQEVVSSATVFTQSAVSVNDTIDGSTVIAVSPEIGLDGTIEFYEVYLI